MAQAAQVNPNQDTSDMTSPVQVAPGDKGLTNFDDLDNLMSSVQGVQTPKDLADEASKEDIAESLGQKEKLKKALAGKEKEKPEEEDSDQADEDDLAARKTDDEDQDSIKKVLDTAKKSDKLYKVKQGDDELSIAAETEFEVSVRGKSEKVPLRDLLSNYSGKTDWTRKYNELNQDKQSFEKQKGLVTNYINNLHNKLVVEKDALGGLYLLAEAMGGDPKVVVQEFQKQMTERVEALSLLSPEERRIKELEDQMTLDQRAQEAKTRLQEDQQIQTEMERRTTEVLQQTGMSQERLAELYNDLVDSGEVPKEEITPELVGDYYKEIEVRDSLSEILKEVNPSFEGDKLESAVTELREAMVANPSFAVADMKDIALQVYGTKKARALSKKLEKSKPVSTSQQKPAVVTPQSAAVSFDDL